MTDPIADLLTRVRNAALARLDECVVPHSVLKKRILEILTEEGYLSGVAESKDERGHKILVAKMKYVDGTPAITGLKRVSTPGRRLYSKSSELPRVLRGLGIAIVTTSKGVMTDSTARREKVGGEIICNVW
jgi:small subunit ribosomal protein S8